MIGLRLPDCDNAICRQVIRRGEFKPGLPVGAGFQAPLPKRQSAKFFADILNIRNGFLSAVTNSESFLRQGKFGEIVDVTVKGLISAYGKRILRVKFLAYRRQLPVAQCENGVINGEHQKIDVGNRLVLGSDAHFTAHHVTWLCCGARELRLNF